MRLFLAPFKAEAKLLASILPNCKLASDDSFPNRWTFKGGEIISWNSAGAEALLKAIERINFDKFSSVILFGSSGALAPDLKLGEVFSCTEIMDFAGRSIKLSGLKKMLCAKLLTSEKPVETSEGRNRLYEKYKADLVDMESFAFAQVAIGDGICPFLSYVVRFVSDTQDKAFNGKFPDEIRAALVKYRNAFVEDVKS